MSFKKHQHPQRRQFWLNSLNLLFGASPGLATRYHQKAIDIIIIGGHGLGAFIQPRDLMDLGDD
jgi:hypothetical protein